MRIYLDNAATTPLAPEVIEVMHDTMVKVFGNPSSIHFEGRMTKAKIEEARKKIASYLKASTAEIFFTSGGTESTNMALKGAVNDLGVQRIISSPLEHHCVLHTLESLKRTGVQVEMLRFDKYGRADFEHLEALLQQEKSPMTLVSLMHANNEIGTVQDMNTISKICEKNNALFHSDTVQTVGHFPIDVSSTKIHFLTGGAHKFHGPKGIGFVYINHEVQIKPMIEGGSQERNMRGGTENVIGIVGMAKALELSYDNMDEWRKHIIELRNYFIQQLCEHFEDIQFNGDYAGDCLYTILNVSFPPSLKSSLMLMQLDIEGISASGGSACSSGAEGGSHVLIALGADENRKAVRFSFSHYNTKEEIDWVIEKLKIMLN
jgi:cysteine desulfurase